MPYAGFIVGQFVAGAFVFRFTGQLVLAVLVTVAWILPVGYLMGLITLRLIPYPYLIFS